MPVKYRWCFELLVAGVSSVYRRQTCPILTKVFFSVRNNNRETLFCVKWQHCHFARRSVSLIVNSIVLTNFVVHFSMIPATCLTSHIPKMAAHRLQCMFSAWEVVESVLQPGSDEEEDVVGAFSDSDRELLDSDDDYIPVHDDEWSDVSEFFLFFFYPLGYLF